MCVFVLKAGFYSLFCFFALISRGQFCLLSVLHLFLVSAHWSLCIIRAFIFLSWLLDFCLADSHATCDTTQPDTASSRWPGQQGILRVSRKSGEHVRPWYSHRLQQDEPAPPEPAAGPLVQPGQAAGARSVRCLWVKLKNFISLIFRLCRGPSVISTQQKWRKRLEPFWFCAINEIM